MARQAAGFETAIDACEAMHLVQPTYDSHENGGRAISVKSAIRYSDFYDINLDWLLKGVGPMRGRGHVSELAGLTPEAREQVRNLISLLRAQSAK